MRHLVMAIALVLLSSGSAAAQSDIVQPPDDILQLARNQAASTLGITADRLTLTMSQPISWPDSSLGCPQPGMAYSQIVTPGWQMTFDIDDGTWEVEVHTDDGSHAVIC